MVERVALEKRCARNSTEGSNPSLSAECRVRHIIRYGATSDDVANLPLSAIHKVHPAYLKTDSDAFDKIHR